MVAYLARLGSGLFLGKSAIPGSGRGVFASRSYSKGVVITGYKGKLVSPQQMEVLFRKGKRWYFVTIEEGKWYKDGDTKGKRGDYAGQLINDPRNPRLTNCAFCIHGNDCYVFAVQDIRPGDELFLDYGDTYWGTWKIMHRGREPFILRHKPLPKHRSRSKHK